MLIVLNLLFFFSIKIMSRLVTRMLVVSTEWKKWSWQEKQYVDGAVCHFLKMIFFMHLFIFQAILIIYFHFCVPPCRKIFFIKFIYLYKSFTHTNKPRFLAQKIPCSGQLSHDLKNVDNLKKWCIENTFSTTKCAKVGLNPSCHTWYQSI